MPIIADSFILLQEEIVQKFPEVVANLVYFILEIGGSSSQNLLTGTRAASSSTQHMAAVVLKVVLQLSECL